MRKSKYDALSNRLKKEVGRLDALMNEHGEIFGLENSYLNILIVCELLLACKFVFEEKFRKSKHSLFSKCERIYGQHEFQAVFG